MGGRLEGKVAVITGGASGIGRASVELMALEGARVVLADILEDRGEAIAAAHRGRVVFQRTDVLREADLEAAVSRAVREFGRLDILFNNAGTGGARAEPEEVDEEAFASVMNLHVRAALFGIKHAAPAMREAGGGSIITTASVAGLGTGYGPFLYSIAKGAILHLTRLAAVRYGPERIRVNCVCPGFIVTAIFGRGMGLDQATAEQMMPLIAEGAARSQPVPRAGEGRDIAEAVLYLASDAAAFVTGQALTVDGGLTLGPFGANRADRFRPILEALGLDPAMVWAPADPAKVNP